MQPLAGSFIHDICASISIVNRRVAPEAPSFLSWEVVHLKNGIVNELKAANQNILLNSTLSATGVWLSKIECD